MPKAGSSSGSPMWMTGAQALRPSSSDFPRALVGNLIGNGTARLDQGPIWDTSVAGGSLMCYTTMPTP